MFMTPKELKHAEYAEDLHQDILELCNSRSKKILKAIRGKTTVA